MNKDVIYIDVDDDVTAIIGKIKSSKEKIVAIVPPKRAGALQSAVNLRLLDRMAKNDKKQLVLITNNHALSGLAANAKIPVAKNLQSKPELAEIPALAVDDGDDIIDGSALPVGELAKTVKGGGETAAKGVRSDAIDDISTEDLAIDGDAAVAAGAVAATRRAGQPVKKKSPKIPDFDIFRKKLIFIILGGVGLTALLIWMFVFAPAARVVITASTTPAPVSASVKLGGTAASDYKAGVISSVSQTEKKDVKAEFVATGQKDVGEKATGTVRLSSDSFGALLGGISIPAGTKLTSSSGKAFLTDSSVTLTATSGGNSKTVGITAADSGESYNGASGSMSGAPSTVSATIIGGATSGGTTRVVKVVTADDVERAKGEVLGKSTNEEKAALIKKFTNGEKVIDTSFVAEAAEPVATPAVGQEAPDGKGELTVSTTYSIQAISKTALEAYLNSYLASRADAGNSQKVYNTGVDKASITNFQKAEDGTMTATVIATGSIGPEIDEAEVKEQVKGKIYGEVQQTLQAVNGIKDVDVKFSYFWVRKVPNDINKITIEFKVDSNNG